MRWALLILTLLLAACSSEQISTPGEALKVNGNLAPAVIGTAYNGSIIAEGGVRPYTYTLEGTLPKGITFAQGKFSGTPTEKGTFSLTITVDDANLSSKFIKLTLRVTDPPPPVLKLTQPQAETDQPFILVVRLETMEARGFMAQFVLGPNLRPNLDTLVGHPTLVHTSRFDEKGGILEVDGVLSKAAKDLEVLRLTLVPAKAARPNIQVRASFFDKASKNFDTTRLTRTYGEGKYHFTDLVSLSDNWGKKAPAPKEGAAPSFLPFDLNKDGAIDGKDLEVLRAGYSWKPNAAATNAPAPTNRSTTTPNKATPATAPGGEQTPATPPAPNNDQAPVTPPTTTPTPPAETTPPPADSEKPPADDTQPPDETTPPADDTQPPAASEEPPAATTPAPNAP
jgi:hypothetical protein